MKCKKTLIMKGSGIETITEGVDYPIESSDETGVYIENNQGDRHHFSPEHQEEYFEV